MFDDLQVEITRRFTTAEQHFRKSPKTRDEVGQTTKGLVFVEIYATYEHTVREATKLAISKIASHGHTFSGLRTSLLALFLNAELTSVRAIGEDGVWDARISLFERCLSDGQITTVDVTPHDGSHFRHTQLKIIFKTLGINRPVTRLVRHRYWIDTVVEHRNSIAHGRETAAEVGRQYSRRDILAQIRRMQEICIRLITVISQHCDDPARHCR